MTQYQLASLIKMINQIAENQSHLSEQQAAEVVATHIKKFWARSMKTTILDFVKSDGSGLSERAKLALNLL